MSKLDSSDASSDVSDDADEHVNGDAINEEDTVIPVRASKKKHVVIKIEPQSDEEAVTTKRKSTPVKRKAEADNTATPLKKGKAGAKQ